MLKALLHLAFCCAIAFTGISTLSQYSINNQNSHSGEANLHPAFIHPITSNVPYGLYLFNKKELIINDVEVEDENINAYWNPSKSIIKTYPLSENYQGWSELNLAHLSYLHTDLPPPIIA